MVGGGRRDKVREGGRVGSSSHGKEGEPCNGLRGDSLSSGRVSMESPMCAYLWTVGILLVLDDPCGGCRGDHLGRGKGLGLGQEGSGG